MADDNNPLDPGELLSSVEEAATKAESDAEMDQDSSPDAWWLRWLKFLSIILIAALILGLGLMFADMAAQYHSNQFAHRQLSQPGEEWLHTEKSKFWMGSAIGGGLGLIYVIRCIVRKVDP